MQRQHDDQRPRPFDQFEDDLDQHDHPETHGFWDAVPAGRLDRLREARHRARTQRRSTARPTAVPTAPEVVQRLHDAGQHVDPLLKRAGMLMSAIALLVPIAMAFRSGDDTVAIAAATTAATAGASAPSTIKWYEPLPTRPPTSVTAPGRKPSTPPAATTPVTTPSRPPTATTTASAPQVAAASVECTSKYTVVAGDSWILIARKVKVTLDQMLAANNATKRTMLWPRQKICLPPNATPTTVPRPTPTTVRPTPTTSRPVTTVPRVSYSRAQVEQIIREVWPDDLEAKALAIAVRESNLNPYSQNFCCSGLFQIYFNVHRGWLAGIGVTSANQLLDPRVNAAAALKLYQRNGWGPWE